MTTTLLAATGMSPAIVTETLWTLAHESPRRLPEKVVFITTVTGATAIETQLFTPIPDWHGRTAWESLRLALKAKPHQLIAEPPRIISLADGTSGRAALLDDIRTPAENAAAAECIFSEVWNIVRDKDQSLIASIAGGRKTMGALLHSAVSLIGRETDRLTHVLVDPPYDTLPGFFFPGQPDHPLLDRAGRAFLPQQARLMLADVPFVPLRNRFRELDDLPGSFLGLRQELSQRLSRDANRKIPIAIDHRHGLLTVDGQSFNVRARALAILAFVLEANQNNTVPEAQKEAVAPCASWFQLHRAKLGKFDGGNLDDHDFSRELNYLRDVLKNAAWRPAKRTLRQSAPFDFAGWQAIS